MNVQVFLPDESDFEVCDFDPYIKIKVDDKQFLTILKEDIEDVTKIPSLLKLAYEAGLRKEELNIIRK